MFDALAQKTNWSIYSFGNIIRINTASWININDADTYQILGVRSWGEGVVIKRSVVGAELTMKRYRVSSSEQLMWCKVDTKNGAFGVTKGEHIGALASSNMCLADIDTKRCLPALLQLFFRLPAVYKGLTAVSLGTTNRQYLKPQELLTTVRLHLPPIEEQRSLVARIEELSAKIAEARRLRSQTVVEVDAIISSELNAFFKRAESNQVELKSIGNFTVYDRYGPRFYNEAYSQEGVPIMRATDIDNTGRVDYRFMPRMYVSFEEKEKLALQLNDLVVVRSGSVGLSAVFDRCDITCIPAAYIIQFRFDQSVSPHYVRYCLQALFARDDLKGRGTALKNVNAPKIKSIKIPVPPLPEQRRLVAYLDNLQTKVDALKHLQAETAAELNALLPSILNKAFKGEL